MILIHPPVFVEKGTYKIENNAFSLVVSPLHSVRTYIIETLVCPYQRLTAETKFDVPDGTSLGFKPPAFNSFEIYLVHRSFLHISILC